MLQGNCGKIEDCNSHGPITTGTKVEIKEDMEKITRGTLERAKFLNEANTVRIIVVSLQGFTVKNNNCQQYDIQNAETTLNTANAKRHNKTTAISKKVCHSCGYPNHIPRNCKAGGRSNSRDAQTPFNSQSKS